MGNPLKLIFDKSRSIEVEANYIVDDFLSKSDNMGYSIVRTHLNGEHPFMKNIRSNRTYYLLEGNAIFLFEEKEIIIQKGEMLVIPKDTKYAFKGIFDAILIDCPAFDPNDDIIYNEALKNE